METADHEGGVIGDLLHAVRLHFGMDVAFVSEFTGGQRVFRFVDAGAQDLVIAGARVTRWRPRTANTWSTDCCPRLIPDLALNEAARADLGLEAPDGLTSYLGVPITFP